MKGEDEMELPTKTEYLSALRSDNYTQGNGALRGKNNTYCCLGVYCDLITDGWWKEGIYSYVFEHKRLDISDDAMVPIEICPSWLENWQIALYRMNDSGKYSFKDIADYIEENL